MLANTLKCSLSSKNSELEAVLNTGVTRRQKSSQVESTMRRTSAAALFFLLSLASVSAISKTEPDCLNHLGGTSYDVDCYGGLTKDIEGDSERVYRQLRKTIPVSSKFRQLLDEYMATQNAAEKFCLLDKEAGTDWEPSPSTDSYNMWDGIYAGCIYNMRKAQNARLRSLLKLHSEN